MKTLGILMHSEPSSGGGFQYESAILAALLELAEENRTFKPLILTDDASKLWNHAGEQSSLRFGSAKVLSINVPNTLARTYAKPEPRSKCELFRVPVDPRLNEHLTGLGINALYCLSPSYKGIQSGLPYSMPIWDLMHRHTFPVYYPELFDNETPSHRDLLYVNACLSAHTIIAESEAGKEDILRHYGACITVDRIKLVDFIPKQSIPRTTSLSFPSPAIAGVIGRPFFYYPAQFWKHKHHDTLIHALKSLEHSLDPGVKLVFSGSAGDYDRQEWHAELLKQTQQAGMGDRVLFAGFLPDQDVEYLYTHALATLMPSAFGPSNLPPLEAIALSCPVAVGDAYGMQQFLPHGVPMLPCSEPQPWADFMARIATDPDFRLSLIESQRANLQHRTYARFKRQVSDALPL